MRRIAFSEEDPRFNDELRLFGVGSHEAMPEGFVSRQQGLPAWLLVHFHDSATVEIRGTREVLPPETAVLWDRRRPHFFGCAERAWDHSWVVFGGGIWQSDLDWMRPLFEVPVIFEQSEVLQNGFARLLREFNEMERPNLPILADNIRLLMRELARKHQTRLNTEIDPVQRACRWLAQHLDEKLTVAEVSARVGYSETRTQQLFHARHGCSVQVWIERQRLQEVRYWLMHSGLNVGEIAERTGFSDAFYLSRRFSRAFGTSPSQYRKTHFGAKSEPQSLPRSN